MLAFPYTACNVSKDIFNTEATTPLLADIGQLNDPHSIDLLLDQRLSVVLISLQQCTAVFSEFVKKSPTVLLR